MFFFISGYFTPSSFRKKGKYAFIRDKFKRLGIPFVVVSWFYFPLCMLSAIYMINNIGSVSGAADDDVSGRESGRMGGWAGGRAKRIA